VGHRGISRSAFIREFSDLGIPEDIPRAVFDYYKKESWLGNFEVSPSDSLADVYGRHDEAGIEDDAHTLLLQLGFSGSSEPSMAEPRLCVKEVRDMVFLLDQMRR
jgi:hypothetical protein